MRSSPVTWDWMNAGTVRRRWPHELAARRSLSSPRTARCGSSSRLWPWATARSPAAWTALKRWPARPDLALRRAGSLGYEPTAIEQTVISGQPHTPTTNSGHSSLGRRDAEAR